MNSNLMGQPQLNLFGRSGLVFPPHTVTNVLLIGGTLLQRPLHITSSLSCSHLGGKGSGETGSSRRVCRLLRPMDVSRTERSSVCFESSREGQDSGVSVLGLAGLCQELLLIKPVCFGRHTVALSSDTCTALRTRISHTSTTHCLFWQRQGATYYGL